MSDTLFILGGTGFIGREVVREAVGAGWSVKALARSEAGAEAVRKVGGQVVRGTVERPHEWIAEARGSTVLIDLVQPRLPKRIGRRAMRHISTQRRLYTTGLLKALGTLPSGERPLFFAVSGIDDLQPDAHRTVSDDSPLRQRPMGFARIGLPVRRLVDASGLVATHVYLGTVYGPGKTFAEVIVPGLAKGKMRIIGKGTNHLPLVHVNDVARALVHLAGQPRASIQGRSLVVTDGADTTQQGLLEQTAQHMGVPRPRHVPTWLASVVGGSVLVETICRDVHTNPAFLRATGFGFLHPSIREGVPATLTALGWRRNPGETHA